MKMVCTKLGTFLGAIRKTMASTASGMTSGEFLSSEGLPLTGYYPAVPGRPETTAVTLLLFLGGHLPAPELLVFSHSGTYHLEHP